MLNNSTSIAVKIELTSAPAEEVSLDMTVDVTCCTDALFPNSLSKITLDPAVLTFTPWNKESEFFVTVQDWDFDKGDQFMVHFSFSGVDMMSYYVEDGMSLVVDVVPKISKYAELDVFIDLLETDQFSYWGVEATGSD